MFIAQDKLNNQGLRQAIVVAPERSIGGSFADEPLTQWRSAISQQNYKRKRCQHNQRRPTR